MIHRPLPTYVGVYIHRYSTEFSKGTSGSVASCLVGQVADEGGSVDGRGVAHRGHAS